MTYHHVPMVISTVNMLNAMDEDDYNLEVLGYKPSFRREFSNLATISFAFSIMVLTFFLCLALSFIAIVTRRASAPVWPQCSIHHYFWVAQLLCVLSNICLRDQSNNDQGDMVLASGLVHVFHDRIQHC